MCGFISTEFLRLTVDSFESSLASDDVLAHFFNDFLSAPSFPEALRYNRETGLFEMASRAAEFVSTRIRSALYNRKSQLLAVDPSLLTKMPPIDNHYAVCCLDRERGMQWIKKERFPFFLQSDCYHEYRLAKLLLQWDPNLCIHRRKSSSVRTTLSAPQLRSLKLNTGFMSTRNLTCLTSLQKEQLIPKSSDSTRCYSSWSEPESLCSFPPLSSSGFSSAHLQSGKPQELKSSQTELGVCSGLSSVSKEKPLKEISSLASHSPEQHLEYLAVQVTEQVLKDTMNVTDGPNQADTWECFSKSGDQANCSSTDRSCKCDLNRHLNRGRLEGEKERRQLGKRGCGWDKKDQEEGSRATNQEDVPYTCCSDTGFYGSLDKFREFLQGTSGEKLLNLWMDIERLKAARDKERKHRYLVLMRSCYLLSSSQFSLNAELLSRLGLTTSPCWTEDKLRSVQTCLTEPLLHYWVPRFWTSLCHQEDHSNSSDVELRTGWCYSSSLGSQPRCCSTFLRTDISSPQSSHTVRTQVMSSRSQLQCSTMMEKMLQALCAESRAGSYFTHFCEQSGNQLWVNALYFWTDLQYYRELFYQDGLDPYRVQREAQFLYSTYLFSSARRRFGVDEKLRREVYDRLMPPFEELFDRVEEHALNILVEAWTTMVNRDTESFQQVAVQEEVRSIDSWEYRELCSLYEESQLRLEQGEQCSSMLSASSITPTHTSDSWSRVSPNYRGYRLGSLLRHRHEIGHFMSFLQNQNASIHLMCWLDLEQYRRTPRQHKAIRQERSAWIAARYLNRKYFFGSDSPAMTEQQNDILHLAGGIERLKLECLSNPVVVEIQDVVRNHIEKTWLPLFLSTTEFIERQKRRPEPQEVAGRLSQHVHRQRRARKEAWKAEGLWMSSTKEILLFRQTLLNPVTCQQFQDFVYSKGGFLENDVLFWLEVQRYKDLCHSHSDDATIQQKVSTIISCFINSSMPPALQIDIPPQQAQHILEKRHELGPYIFREAQMSVFDELLKFWPEFQELISSIQEEQLIPLLQEKRVKHRARVRRQRRREEEEEEEKNKGRRRAQEDMESQETSVTEEDEDDEDDEEEGDDDDRDEANEPEERSEKKQSSTRSRVLFTPTQTLSWSYSKYMAGLKREEVLLRRRSQLETTFSTASESSSNRSIKSASSEQSYRQPSQRSSRTNSKQCNRYNRGVRA
ncbi:regulator of G-protein signaling 22 isoform X1 [Haplochromis burtoni]|uniref:regulator of G-protein signaling 22 isoform X1 n=1 Tax=Haplochromis burtoni TaxID=8153 RepID=UPI0003BC719D|nr:regulator of G-protein signaling 22 isoform X1 [Haplochromis burtoni]